MSFDWFNSKHYKDETAKLALDNVEKQDKKNCDTKLVDTADYSYLILGTDGKSLEDWLTTGIKNDKAVD